MNWEFRILRVKIGKDYRYGIHEVSYEANGRVMWTENPIPIDSYQYDAKTPEDSVARDTLRAQLKRIELALDKEILDVEKLK